MRVGVLGVIGVLSLACTAPSPPSKEAVSPEPKSPRVVGPAAAVPPPSPRRVPSPQIFCGTEAERGSCTFSGRVGRVRPTSVAVDSGGLQRVPVTAIRLDLASDDAEDCPSLAVPPATPARRRAGVRTFFVALPEDAPPLDVATGDPVCGSADRYSLGYDRGFAGVLYAGGEVALAYSPGVPRSRSPLPGWTFRPTQRRRAWRTDEDVWRTIYDVEVAHGGAVAETSSGGARLSSASGDYWVEAEAYRNEGALPPWQAWMGRAGYSFAIVRMR